MMDRNREARRAAAMANGLPRRRHRTTTGGGSLRESPEDEGPLELQETAARLRDRTAKKERDREMRDRGDRDHRERDRDRLSRSKRRRGDKYMHREDGGGGDDDSSEGSVNDEDEDDDDGRVRYVPPSNHVPMSSSSPASTLTSHRKSYPPPSKVLRVAPTWKAPDEMIGVSIPRKARSSSTKRGHDWSTVGGVMGEVSRQPSSSPVRSTMTATVVGTGTVVGGVSVPPPSPAPPMSPSSSNVSIKKKIANNNGLKQRPPKSSSKSSPSIQDEIEIEVAEVLYGLMRQSQAPSKQQQDGVPNDSTARSTADSKSRVSSPISHSPFVNNHAAPLTTVAPKRKRPRPYPEEIQGVVGPLRGPITSKLDPDQAAKMEPPSPSVGTSGGEYGGDMINSQEFTGEVFATAAVATVGVVSNGGLPEGKQGLGEESGGGIRNGMVRCNSNNTTTKVEEASSSPKLESPQNHDRVESSTTSTKPNSSLVEENHREEKFEIDLMAPPQTSPEREKETAEYKGGEEKSIVTDRETEVKGSTKPKEKERDNDSKGGVVKINSKGGDLVELNTTICTTEVVEDKIKSEVSNSKLNFNDNAKNFDLQLDLEKSSVNVNEEKLIFQKQQQQPPPPKATRDDPNTDNKHGGGQSGSGPLPMSVPGGWHGGLAPMGYVGPLQGVVSMDGTPMASPPIQSPHFLFSQPKPKRCATHCYIARSVSVHQQMMKMNPFWPAAAAAAAAGTAPIFGGKPYNLNMVPPTDLHAAGRGVVVNSSQDSKGQPFTFFPSQPAASPKDKSPHAPSVPDSAQKKQFLLQPALPPGAPSNILHAPALFFPMGQQQAAVPSVRPGSTKSQSIPGAAASTSAPSTANVGASNAGPAMSFSYPNMGVNETQFMAILGNSAYPFPIPAHVGAAPPYRGTHPQAMPFFNGSFYSSQMLHPSQLQQQQAAQTSQSMQIQQQNQPNPSISTASSSSQKHLQNQQLRPQGSSTPGGVGTSNHSGLQNLQAVKGRTAQPHHDMGGEDSPSTADSRTRQNMSVYGQNFAMPFNSPNFALMTSAPAMGSGGVNNATGVSNGNLGDKKQQQPQQNPAFPMSFATMNGTATPGLDMSSIAHNHAIMMQSLPEAARQNYQLMAAQAVQHKKNSYRGPEDGKSGSGGVTDTSSVDEERKAMAMRASAASGGQSIAFSRDLGDNSTSTMPGNTVVDSSARTINLVHGSYTRPSRSSVQNSVGNPNASNPSQSQQQMLFPKQQQYAAAPSVSSGRSKTPTTNGNVYPDHLGSSSIMAAKFPNSLSGFPPLVQTSVAPAQSTQWKNSVRPNASQVSSPSVATSTTSNMKNLPQQPGRSQQNHTQISFGPAGTNPKSSSTQGQQTQNNNQAPSSPMVMGSPSNSSVSKGASASPRTTASVSTGSKAGGQGSIMASQQGKSSQAPSLSSQKQSILGSPHHIMSASSTPSNKPQMQQSQLQPQLSKQNIQQAQLYFSNYMQQSTSAAMGPYYNLQRQRPDTQQQQQGPGSKSQGSAGSISSSSGMLSLCNPVSVANTSTSDPVKAVAAAATAANGMKGTSHSQGMLHAAAQFAAQSAMGAQQLMPAGFPYAHAVSTSLPVKPTEQKQPAGE